MIDNCGGQKEAQQPGQQQKHAAEDFGQLDLVAGLFDLPVDVLAIADRVPGAIRDSRAILRASHSFASALWGDAPSRQVLQERTFARRMILSYLSLFSIDDARGFFDPSVNDSARSNSHCGGFV